MSVSLMVGFLFSTFTWSFSSSDRRSVGSNPTAASISFDTGKTFAPTCGPVGGAKCLEAILVKINDLNHFIIILQ